MGHDVFISYSTKDKTVADAACAQLEAHKIRCWIAPRDVSPGDEFAGSIKRAIQEARMMVLIFSASSNNSPHVLREVNVAVNHEVIIIPFRIDDVSMSDELEYYLGVPHWLDALSPPLEQHLDRLTGTVTGIIRNKRIPPTRVQPRSEPADSPLQFKYATYVSFANRDRSWATWLVKSLRDYRVPKRLVQFGAPSRIGPVSYDKKIGPTSGDLVRYIDDSLRKIDHLLVVCSPATPGSEWVRREIEYFQEMGKGQKILPVLVEGEPRESIPRELYRRSAQEYGREQSDESHREFEPIIADARRRSDRKRAIASVVTWIIGIQHDDMKRAIEDG